MPLKTLHLTNSWHATSGGVATLYRALIEASNRQGQFIRLVVPGESDHTEEVGEFGKIHYVKAPLARFNSQYRLIYPNQFVPMGSRIQNILVEERPDIVEICDKYTLNYLGALLRRDLLPALNFRPIVVGLTCERMDDNFRSYVGHLPLSRAFCAAYMRWLYFPFFDHHIANSEYTADELRSASRGQIVPRNVWIRPMGVDLRHFSPARKSCQTCPGAYRSSATSKSLTNWLPFANADALVHPNPREPFGIAPLEAMASGLPVVVPNTGGIATYATSENAWIAAADRQSFVSAIQALLTESTETDRRKRNALRTVAEFSWDKVAASFLKLYAELHLAGMTRRDALPLPAFRSTPASGLTLAFTRGISQTAEKVFRLTSTVLWG